MNIAEIKRAEGMEQARELLRLRQEAETVKLELQNELQEIGSLTALSWQDRAGMREYARETYSARMREIAESRYLTLYGCLPEVEV